MPREWIIELRIVANDGATSGGFDVSRAATGDARAEILRIIEAADEWSAEEVRLGLRCIMMPVPLADGEIGRNERWRPWPGNPFYDVSDLGRVRSWSSTHQRRTAQPRLLSPYEEHGYYRVRIASRHEYVHRMVLESFIGPAPDGLQACHYNGVPSDCRLENLRWDTPLANAEDRLRHGTHLRGEASPLAKLTDVDAAKIRKLAAAGMSTAVIAKRYGIAKQTVCDIRSGRRYQPITEKAKRRKGAR